MSAATMRPSMAVRRAWSPAARQETYDGVRIGPPPDLASLLLHNRIVYLGMPMVGSAGLVVAELLYLNYESPSKPVTLYINSPGTVNAQGQAVGFETEAFAIADCMSTSSAGPNHVVVRPSARRDAPRPGRKGQALLPAERVVMLHQPRSRRGARPRTSPFARRK